ncbi:hypothetical protein H4R18_004706 [Coemansia javaensis]|uniref:Uncharacterized protein n=1 Tax=Coemansia javaensis TaxID=2761396 RepID=A0A9W8LGP5_9FUNG|nr:hypothetical protein H4R18_004706 [Coemansia javaensis]
MDDEGSGGAAAAAAAAEPRRYTVSVAGAGQSTGDSVCGLRVGGQPLDALVAAAAAGRTGAVWLDIQCPGSDDIGALERAFGMGTATVRRLLDAAAAEPECLADDGALYLCWAEVAGSDSSISQYVSSGGPIGVGSTADQRQGGTDKSAADKSTTDKSTADKSTTDKSTIDKSTATTTEKSAVDMPRQWAGGYVPVPPWLQPSATQVLTRLDVEWRWWRRPAKGARGDEQQRRVRRLQEQAGSEYLDVEPDPQAEAARRRQALDILRLLGKPAVANREQLRAAIRRWGPGHEQWWREVENSALARGADPARRDRIQRLARGARDLIGHRTVQLWARGPVVVTLRRQRSEAVAGVARELARRDGRLAQATPLTIVQALAERWVCAAAGRLPVLSRWADVLDHDLTQPVRRLSLEAASWTPIIARCRKASLALLRRCQVDEAVLAQLCAAAPAALGAHPSRLAALHRLRARTADARRMYKRIEQRLSRLHRMLLDRQCLRLLKTSKEIHRYFRVLVSAELVFLPIELWYNLDNLNGITTPGSLPGEENTDEDFWLTVLGMVIWAMVAVSLYLIYTRFFELKHESLRVANIRSMQLKQRQMRRRSSRRRRWDAPRGLVGALQRLFSG